MTDQTSPHAPGSLKELLAARDPALRDLFIKTLNRHAGYQIKPLEGKQLVAQVRKDIEDSLGEN